MLNTGQTVMRVLYSWTRSRGEVAQGGRSVSYQWSGKTCWAGDIWAEICRKWRARLVPVWGRGFQAEGAAPTVSTVCPSFTPFPPSHSLENKPQAPALGKAQNGDLGSGARQPQLPNQLQDQGLNPLCSCSRFCKTRELGK